jgi:hypothetical protein
MATTDQYLMLQFSAIAGRSQNCELRVQQFYNPYLVPYRGGGFICIGWIARFMAERFE